MRLSLLLPARKHVESATFVARWLARGDRVGDGAAGREAALRECFAAGAAILPTAALTRSLDANDAADALWLRADPAFVMADAVTLRLLACGKLGLSADETEALAQALKPLFGDAGFAFDAPHPERWYLRCARGTVLPKFSAPEDALGDDLANHLPEGENARRWRALLNEAQIVLTQHPVNARRTQRGMPPVNSLWFWGAGVSPTQVRSEFDCVVSDDAVAVALAGSANIPSFPRRRESSFFFSSFSGKQKQELNYMPLLRHALRAIRCANVRFGILPSQSRLRGNDEQKRSMLVDLADQRDISRLDVDWLTPIDEALKRRRIARLELHFESGERCAVEPMHRWRLWRRAKTLA